MNISLASITSLRTRTGVSISACKQALEESNGDEELAIELLRKRGIAQAAKKAERDQKEGLVFLATNGGAAALVLLRCETDFVARDAVFQQVGQQIADALLGQGEAAATTLAGTLVPELVQKLGENITLGEVHLASSPVVGSYIHSNRKIGVLVGLSAGSVDQARDAAMHAAAMNPLYAYPEEVTAEAVAKEKEIWQEQMVKDQKPPAIIEKIMMGKERKFREENALASQAFVKDPAKTVGTYLGDARIVEYVRLSVG